MDHSSARRAQMVDALRGAGFALAADHMDAQAAENSRLLGAVSQERAQRELAERTIRDQAREIERLNRELRAERAFDHRHHHEAAE